LLFFDSRAITLGSGVSIVSAIRSSTDRQSHGNAGVMSAVAVLISNSMQADWQKQIEEETV
jgi:hypothetical protein